MNNDLFGNPNDSYNSLDNVWIEAKAKHFQPREGHYSKYKNKYSPWITAGIIRIEDTEAYSTGNWRKQTLYRQSIEILLIISFSTTHYKEI